MRVLLSFSLVVLAGCSSSVPRTPVWDGKGLVESISRPSASKAPHVEVTVVEISESAWHRISDSPLGKPGTFVVVDGPAGEIASVEACVRDGLLLGRPTIELRDGAPGSFQVGCELTYLKDWHSGPLGESPVFSTATDGVSGSIAALQDAGAWSLKLEFQSSEVRSLRVFDVGDELKIQAPEVTSISGVLDLRVAPGQTAVVCMGTRSRENAPFVRLVCLRMPGT